jgi:hypothetical protein
MLYKSFAEMREVLYLVVLVLSLRYLPARGRSYVVS